MIKKARYYYSLLAAALIPTIAFAVDPKITLTENPNSSIKGFLANILSIILSFSGALAVLFLIIGGIQYMTSAGDEKKTGVAKKTMTYAIIGLLIVVLSLTIIRIVNSFAGTATQL